MKYTFVPFTSERLKAAAALNERLAASVSAPFLLPQRENVDTGVVAVRREHWLVIDDSGEVRGGCLLQFHRGWVGGREADVVNVQSPLSEGLIDRRHAGVAGWMIKHVEERFRFAYAVGMGSEQAALARLFKALRWRVELVPFFFRVLSGRRMLAYLQPLRSHARFGWAVRAGAFIPLVPDLAFAAVHSYRRAPRSSGGHTGSGSWVGIPSVSGMALRWTVLKKR